MVADAVGILLVADDNGTPLVQGSAYLATSSTGIFLVEGASLVALVASPECRGRCWCYHDRWHGCGCILQQKPIYSHN